MSDDEKFCTYLYTTVPSQFEMTIEMLMSRTTEPLVEEVTAAIQQKAITAAITKDISDPNGKLSPAMNANTSVSHRGGIHGRGRGGRYQHRQPYRKYCNHCKTANHNTDDCRKASRDSASTSDLRTNSNESRKCYYCTRPGHFERGCRTKKAALELRKGSDTTANASLATAIRIQDL